MIYNSCVLNVLIDTVSVKKLRVQIAHTVNSRHGEHSEHVSVIVTVRTSEVRTNFPNFSVYIDCQ